MLYPTKAGGESYVMPSTIFQRKGVTPKYDSGRIMVLGDGGEFEQVIPGVVRLTQNNNVQLCFTTSKGYATSEITIDRNALIQSRFMQTIRDWHNIEFTVTLKYLGGNDTGAIVLGTRGGIGALDPCQGFAYKAGVNLDASGGFFSKQQYSTSGNEYREFDTTKMGSSIKGKFVAIKFVIYDLDHEGNPTTITEDAETVKMELYGTIDSSSPFRILRNTTDDGNWGQAAVCGGEAGVIGLWGGPVCTLEWRDGANIEIQSISIREIDPTANFDDIPQLSSISFTPATAVEQSQENILTASTTEVTGKVNDSLGVQQIYKTKPGGSVWISTPDGLLSDKQFSDNGYTIKSIGGGVYNVPGKSRIQSFSTKENASKGPDFDGYSTHDFEELRKRGAWDSKTTDWRDVEMTGYVKMKGSGGSDSPSGSGDEISWVVRSVRHNGASHSGCGGSSYHGNLHVSGHGRFKKENYHVQYQNDGLLEKDVGRVNGKTVGFKFVCYNINDDKAVKLELYIDKDNNNTWEFLGEKIDAGDWTTNGPDMKHCGATSNTAIISWGSPKVVWKWNDPLEVDISKMSVREIIPTKEDGTTPPGGGDGGGDTPSTGGTGQLSRVQSTFEGIYDVIVDSSGNTCAGAAPPSGTGVYNEITALTVTTITNDKSLAASWSAEDDRDRVGWTVTTSDAILHGERPTKVGVYLKKVGSPTGNLSVVMRDSSDNIKVTYGTLDVSTLTTSYVLHESEFIEDNAAALMGQGFATNWKLAVEYNDASSNEANHVDVGVNYNNPVDGTKTCEFQHEKEPGPGYSNVKHTDRDMCGKLYTSPT